MEDNSLPKKILLAVRPQDLRRVSDALGSEFDLIICHTVEQAKTHFDESIALIACGVRFDGGRMFDLLRAAKENPNTRAIPFYLILGSGKGYSKAILQGIRSAAKALGANGFTDLTRLERDLGKEKAYKRIREIVRRLL